MVSMRVTSEAGAATRTAEQAPRAARVPAWAPGALVAGAAFALYLTGLELSFGGTADSAELQRAAYTMSLAHTTGYPLYLLIARLWIGLVPFVSPALAVTLLSAIFAAGAVWVLQATVARLTGSVVAGTGGALLFAVQAAQWAQASVAEVNSLNTLLTGLSFLMFVKWADGDAGLPVAMLLYGLAASHHRSSILYLPLLAVFFVLAVRRGRQRRTGKRGVAAAALLFVLPFAAYLYVPLRAQTEPMFGVTSWDGFWQYVTGESAASGLWAALQRPVLPTIRHLAGYLFGGAPGWALALIGLAGVVLATARLLQRPGESAQQPSRARLGTVWLYTVAFAVGFLFDSLYDISDISDYLGVPLFMWSVLVGVAIHLLGGVLSRVAAGHDLRRERWLQAALGFGLLGYVVATAWYSLIRDDLKVSYSQVDRRAEWSDRIAQLEAAGPGAVLVADWMRFNEARYLQDVEGRMPGTILLAVEGLPPDGPLILDTWLAERRDIFILDQYQEVAGRFDLVHDGEFWRLGRRRDVASAPQMAHLLDWRLDDGITLLGYTLQPSGPVKAGDTLRVTLYWRAEQRIFVRYTVFNHLKDAQGRTAGQKDDEPLHGAKPTSSWAASETVSGTFDIPVDPAAAPGTYQLRSGMYNSVDQTRLQVVDRDGAPLGDYPLLAEVQVVAP